MMPCLWSLDDEPGVVEVFLIVAERLAAGGIDDGAAGGESYGMAGSGVPLHGGSVARIDVGTPLGNEAYLQAAA